MSLQQRYAANAWCCIAMSLLSHRIPGNESRGGGSDAQATLGLSTPIGPLSWWTSVLQHWVIWFRLVRMQRRSGHIHTCLSRFTPRRASLGVKSSFRCRSWHLLPSRQRPWTLKNGQERFPAERRSGSLWAHQKNILVWWCAKITQLINSKWKDKKSKGKGKAFKC